MVYNLTKAMPILVEDKLLKKIAKINNLDHKTGVPLPKIIEPTQFQLLCVDVKEGIFKFIRNYILSILFIIVLTSFLYYRYLHVKEMKIKREIDKAEHEKILKEKLYRKIKEENKIKQQKELEEKQHQFMENIRNKFNNFDDTDNRSKFFIQNNYQNYAVF